jgi:hypothetical protein
VRDGIVGAMATRRCPKCKLVNPGSTAVCDCGWSFVDETMGEARHLSAHDEDEPPSERRSRGVIQLGVGALLVVAGIGITAVTYGSASVEGGMYIIAYGPIVGGVVTIVRGLFNMNR